MWILIYRYCPMVAHSGSGCPQGYGFMPLCQVLWWVLFSRDAHFPSALGNSLVSFLQWFFSPLFSVPWFEIPIENWTFCMHFFFLLSNFLDFVLLLLRLFAFVFYFLGDFLSSSIPSNAFKIFCYVINFRELWHFLLKNNVVFLFHGYLQSVVLWSLSSVCWSLCIFGCWFWSTVCVLGCFHYECNTAKLTGSSVHTGRAYGLGPHSVTEETEESPMSGSVIFFP